MANNNTEENLISEGDFLSQVFGSSEEAPPKEDFIDDLLKGVDLEKPTHEEEETPPVDKTVEGEPPLESEPGNSDFYLKSLTTLMDKGVINTFEAVVGEDGEEIPLSEVDMTPELYNTLIEEGSASKVEELNSSFVSKENLSDVGRKLLELDMSGGDISEAVQIHTEVIRPLQGLDLQKNVEHQRAAVAMLKQSEGYKDEDVVILVQSLKGDALKKAAQIAKDSLETQYDNYLQHKQIQIQQEKEQKLQQQLTTQETLRTKYKEFGVNKKYSEKLVSKVSEVTEHGDGIDALYNKVRQDPERVHKLLLFLENEEEFVKHITSRTINKINQRTFNTIQNVKKVGASGLVIKRKTSKSKSNKTVGMEEIIDAVK